MKKFFYIIKRIMIVVFLILTIILILSINNLNIIPTNYFNIGACLLTLLTLFLTCYSLKRTTKKFIKVIKICCIIIIFLCIPIYSYGIYCIHETVSLLDNNTIAKAEITDYYVIVKKDSIYEEISDLYRKSIAYASSTDEKVLNSLKLDLTFYEELDINRLKEKLFSEQVDAILITDIIKNQYEDLDEQFETQTRILKTISITKPLENITKKVSLKNTPFNVYISGIDSYGNINKTSRNDVNIIATINPNTNQILLTSIPRDYYVTLHGTTGYKDKLTHASYYGIDTAIHTIEDILDIDINYYIKVNFTTVIDLVDKLGGIDVYADQKLSRGDCNFKVGYNHINGACALVFARERYSYSDGDRHRGRNQQEIIKAIFQKITTNGTNIIYQYTGLLNALDQKFVTNLNRDEIMNYLKFELNDLSRYTIDTIQLDGTGDMQPTYSYPNQKLWVMQPDINTIEQAKNKINSILK